MVATIDSKWVTVGAVKYPRRLVSLQMARSGEFLEAQLMASGTVIDICSSNPANTTYYQNPIFTKTTPESVFQAAQATIRVIGESNLNAILIERTITPTKGRIINQPNTFVIGNVVAPTDNGYVKSVLATQDKWGFFIVIEATPTSFRIATDPGEYTVLGHGWGVPGTLLFHAQTDGVLTSTPPTSGQFIPALASVVDDNTIYFQPNLINRRLV